MFLSSLVLRIACRTASMWSLKKVSMSNKSQGVGLKSGRRAFLDHASHASDCWKSRSLRAMNMALLMGSMKQRSMVSLSQMVSETILSRVETRQERMGILFGGGAGGGCAAMSLCTGSW